MSDNKLWYYSALSVLQVEEAIVKQLHYYFSNENLPGDEFLFVKTMQRNSTAYVKIKTLLTFRKLKMLTTTPDFIAQAIIKHSALLEVDENGKAIRRKSELPGELLDEKKRLRRCIRVDNVPTNQTVEEIEKNFGGEGVVRSARINNGGKRDSEELHAIIEFETEAAAKHAMGEKGWRGGYRLSRVHVEAPPREESCLSPEHHSANGNSASKLRSFEGRLRSIDQSKKCGFIVPSVQSTGKRSKTRSLYFKFDDVAQPELLRVGVHVRYKQRKGTDDAFDVDIVKSNSPTAITPEEKTKQRGKGFMTMAKGPPENTEMNHGFSSVEFRGTCSRNNAA